jgi:hypothetical protein
MMPQNPHQQTTLASRQELADEADARAGFLRDVTSDHRVAGHSFGPIRSALRPPTAIASHQARRRRAGYSLARSGGASLPPAYGCESRAS